MEYQGRLKMSIILAVLGGRSVSTGLAEQLPQPCRSDPSAQGRVGRQTGERKTYKFLLGPENIRK